MGIDDELVRAIFGERRHRPSVGEATRRALRELTSTRTALDGLEAALVRRARFAGTTWAEIAADLGISPPTARRRHVAHDPIGAPRDSRPLD